ncbi:hypothetical protein Vadar_020460 [Vaccinium darrowii]|uniref:Uncharacterized protein n=1 Tax=Vaccinium darrowii TaxID=229202 RepID=A0ACB7YY12_9ERIC|nr:hypothetical protein Vadar_020460 [Vaccinium darrowii]
MSRSRCRRRRRDSMRNDFFEVLQQTGIGHFDFEGFFGCERSESEFHGVERRVSKADLSSLLSRNLTLRKYLYSMRLDRVLGAFCLVIDTMRGKGGMFRYADTIDKLLMLFGTLGSIGNGLMLPLLMVVLSGLINAYGQVNPESTDLIHIVDEYGLKLLCLAIGGGLSGFLKLDGYGMISIPNTIPNPFPNTTSSISVKYIPNIPQSILSQIPYSSFRIPNFPVRQNPTIHIPNFPEKPSHTEIPIGGKLSITHVVPSQHPTTPILPETPPSPYSDVVRQRRRGGIGLLRDGFRGDMAAELLAGLKP